MASYWIKASAGEQVDGPYTGTILKSMATNGRLKPDALVSVDQSKWIVASRVKGLFTAPTPPASTAPPLPPPIPPQLSPPLIPPPQMQPARLPPPLPAAPFIPTPIAGAHQAAPTRSNLLWIWIVAGVAGFIILAACAVLIVPGITHGLSAAREQANRVKCAANLKQLGMGLANYARMHGGHYPSRLEDAVLSGDLKPELLVCPSGNDTPSPGSTPAQWAANLSTGGHCSYLYLGSGLTTAQANASAVLLYESLSAHDKGGINVLVGDGSVTFYGGAAAAQVIQQAKAALSRRSAPSPLPPRRPAPASPPGFPLSTRAEPPLSADSAGLLAHIDLATMTRSGTWHIENGALRSSGRLTEIIGVPGQLPEEYDVSLDFTRISGDEEIGVALQAGSSHFMLLLGASRNTRMGIDLTGPHRLAVAPEAVKGTNLVSMQMPHRLVIKVRKTTFEAALDGTNTYTLTNPDYPSWTLNPLWRGAQNDALALATRGSAVEFHALRITAAGNP